MVRGQGSERVKGKREKDKGLRGTIKGRQWHNQPHPSFAMPILSLRRHASALPYIWYQVSRFGSPSRLRTPACTWHSPYLLHMASTINSINRCPSACPLVLVAPGMTLADLQAYINFTRFEMYYTCMDAQRVRHDLRRSACIQRICMYYTDALQQPYPVQ